MAKYVLLAFDDDAEADQFVEDIQGEAVLAWTPDRQGHTVHAQVRGIYKKPTKFCQCGSKTKAYGRSRKYGWWCCADCGKPKEAWATGDHWHGAIGTNLLPLSDAAPEYRGQPFEKEWLAMSQKRAIAQYEEARDGRQQEDVEQGNPSAGSTTPDTAG
jgi:hypothetical protein